MKKITIIWSFFFIAFITTTYAQHKEAYPFENEIIAFKKADSLKMPAKGGILFIGSSSIRLWGDLEQRFPDKQIIKRGVGGCELAHFPAYYMDAIVYPYEASKIFIYAGENDINNGKSANQVFASFKQLWRLIRAKQPETPIYFLSIKFSNSRTKGFDEVRKANVKIRKFLKRNKNAAYIDVASPLFGTDGKPDDTLFKNDRLHLNTQGYDRWQTVLQPYIN
ncbi:GDSL-type esterase/lipase family protein [Olivibacter domesticus]|uniref:Lysophospholipase L1 n=1 Tax=Olivibacter domesticus TaxID=407022 RepID=A0A1H7VFE7_OLID1|nr:GDSL-type esterase/lipase family protein [Olivibacter domesticus]SEM07991.1 Lysophospholipase L1 [Olivibacter domesticus]